MGDLILLKTQLIQCPYSPGCYKQVTILKSLDQGYIYSQMVETRL